MSVGRAILALNAGSSSLKFALFEVGASVALTLKGEIENLDTTPHFVCRDATGAKLAETRSASSDFASTLEGLLKFVDQHLGEARLYASGIASSTAASHMSRPSA